MSDALLKDRKATLASALITVPINESTSGDKTIRTVNPGQIFRVYGMWLIVKGAVTLTWKSGSTAISGALSLEDEDKISIFSEVPILTGRVPGEDLVLTLGGNVSTTGWVTLTLGVGRATV